MKGPTIEPTRFVYFADFAIYLVVIALATIFILGPPFCHAKAAADLMSGCAVRLRQGLRP